MKTAIIDKEALKILLSKQRQDIYKGVCSASEVLEILGISAKMHSKLKLSGESLLEPSKMKGKYIYSSVLREFKRIHGVNYYNAIEKNITTN